MKFSAFVWASFVDFTSLPRIERGAWLQDFDPFIAGVMQIKVQTFIFIFMWFKRYM